MTRHSFCLDTVVANHRKQKDVVLARLPKPVLLSVWNTSFYCGPTRLGPYNVLSGPLSLEAGKTFDSKDTVFLTGVMAPT